MRYGLVGSRASDLVSDNAQPAHTLGHKRALCTADHTLNILDPKPATAARAIRATRAPAPRAPLELHFSRLSLSARSRPPAPSSITWPPASSISDAPSRVRTKQRRTCSTDADGARQQACSRYVQTVHREAEDTRRFLDKLAAAAAATTQPAQAAGRMDAAVDGTLAHIAHVRREFARAREAEKKAAEEALRKKREDEENRRRREQEASRRAEEEKAEASRRQTAQKAADRQAAAERRQAKHVSPEAQAWADKYRAQYAELRSGLAVRVRQNAALKAYSFRQRGLITRSFGQLKDSMEFVRRVAQTVGDAVADGERVHGADGRRWLLNLAAKALVSQAETEVAVAQPSAYPLAAATVLLAQRFADLPDLLILRLVKKCPLSVPMFLPRGATQSDDEYRRSIGYRENDGALESDALYAERMAGMVAFMAAVAQTAALDGRQNPMPLAHAWTWLARMLNLPPRAISPLMVLTVLTTAGTALAAVYGRQFVKMMDALEREWMPTIAEDNPAAVAAKSNLAGFVGEYRRTGVLRECAGRVIKPQ